MPKYALNAQWFKSEDKMTNLGEYIPIVLLKTPVYVFYQLNEKCMFVFNFSLEVKTKTKH